VIASSNSPSASRTHPGPDNPIVEEIERRLGLGRLFRASRCRAWRKQRAASRCAKKPSPTICLYTSQRTMEAGIAGRQNMWR